MDFVIAPPQQVTVPVANTTSVFPVRRIYCVGRNYADHAIEMGHDPKREPPFFFCKPSDAIRAIPADKTTDIPYPPKTKNLHFEAELVVAISKPGSNIDVNTAMDHVYGYAVGLDLTRRDLQQNMKDLARPWELGKAFDASAPISAIVPKDHVSDIQNISIQLKQNNELKQDGNSNQMIWNIPECISYLSQYFSLQAGDLIFTGTPSGVGAANINDVLNVSASQIGEFSLQFVS